jgi:hypothetical protein
MAVTVVLLVVAVGAVFFLLACLRGFVRAGKNEKTQGLLVRAQSAGDGEDLKPSRSLEFLRQPREIRKQPPGQSTFPRTQWPWLGWPFCWDRGAQALQYRYQRLRSPTVKAGSRRKKTYLWETDSNTILELGSKLHFLAICITDCSVVCRRLCLHRAEIMRKALVSYGTKQTTAYGQDHLRFRDSGFVAMR